MAPLEASADAAAPRFHIEIINTHYHYSASFVRFSQRARRPAGRVAYLKAYYY